MWLTESREHFFFQNNKLCIYLCAEKIRRRGSGSFREKIEHNSVFSTLSGLRLLIILFNAPVETAIRPKNKSMQPECPNGWEESTSKHIMRGGQKGTKKITKGNSIRL